MGKQEKLLTRLMHLQGTFTWPELVSLLHSLGYQQKEGAGSRVKFDNGDPLALISLHKPHPGNELKLYARRQVIEHLKAGGLI